MTLLPVEDALARLLGAARPIEHTETIGLHEAGGRILAADVAARLTQPPFDNSAMDGYALRHADIVAIGTELDVIGTSAAGHAFPGTVGAGQACRIFTGAPLPAGADTVLLQEDAEAAGERRIRTTYLPEKGRHIRPRGQDFVEGEVVLARGDRLDAGRLTVAAAMNHPALAVYSRPKVALLATGDELLPPGSAPGPSQIIASNAFGVGEIAREAGAEVIDLGIAGDDPDAIADAVDWARACGADVLVTLGGASVGDHDLIRPVLTKAGMELDFWRIAMRPGKPLMVGRLGAMQVLGLPGNPVSSLACALLFLEPLLCRLSRHPQRDRRARAITARPLPANDKRQDYLRARLTRRPDGTLEAHAYDKQDSSMMKVFAQSDALIVRKPFAEAANIGSVCDILMLRMPEAIGDL